MVGAATAEAERDLALRRAERQALITLALGWGRKDADVARQARMSRQAVGKIHEAAAGDPDTGPDGTGS